MTAGARENDGSVWSDISTVVLATSVTAAGISPILLLGALAVLIAADVGVGRLLVPVIVAVSYAAASVLVGRCGVALDRLSTRTAILWSSGTSMIVLASCALVVRDQYTIWIAAALAGASLAMGGPSGHLVVARGSLTLPLGLAFGLKQAGTSVANMLAGLALVVVAGGSSHAWRPAFLAFLALPLVNAIWARTRDGEPRHPSSGSETEPTVRLSDLRILSFLGMLLAGGLASSAAVSMDAWGVSPTATGLAIFVGGLASIASKIGLGLLSDRWSDRSLLIMGASISMGALGVALMVLVPSLRVVGLVVAYAAGWGWPGVAFVTAVRRFPHAPAAATAQLVAAMSLGLAVAPLALRAVWSAGGSEIAWLGLAFSAGAGGLAAIRSGRAASTNLGEP